MNIQGEPLQHQERVALKFSVYFNLNTVTSITGILLPLPLGACVEFGWRRGNEEEHRHTEDLSKAPSSAALALSRTKCYGCIVTVCEIKCSLFIRPLCNHILSVLYLLTSLRVAISGHKE